MDTITELQNLWKQAQNALKQTSSSTELEKLREEYTGKESQLQKLLKSLKDLAPEERKQVGQQANEIKVKLTSEIEAKLSATRIAELNSKLETETLDLGLPALPASQPGLPHPLTTELRHIAGIFQRMGFEIHEPYLLDDEYHTFTSLNIPEGHPAKDMWDTIYTEDGYLLITHTSSMQNRIISSKEPPIRAIVPGKCFRNEATDATHEHSFFQLEGVYVDKGIKLSDMIGTLSTFLNEYFGRAGEKLNVPLKIQPTFFPFVEPGLEIMMPKPTLKTGTKGEEPEVEFNPETTDWLEVIPCGPIHPNVITEAGLNAEVYSGFAWGLGLERLIMIKHEINDLRYFHSGRIDFLNQF